MNMPEIMILTILLIIVLITVVCVIILQFDSDRKLDSKECSNSGVEKYHVSSPPCLQEEKQFFFKL